MQGKTLAAILTASLSRLLSVNLLLYLENNDRWDRLNLFCVLPARRNERTLKVIYGTAFLFSHLRLYYGNTFLAIHVFKL